MYIVYETPGLDNIAKKRMRMRLRIPTLLAHTCT